MRGATIAAAAVLVAGPVFGASFTARLGRGSAEVGEAVTLTLSLRGARRRGQPRLRPPAGVRIAAGPSQSQLTRIVNGRMTTSVEFRYTIAFDRPGSYTIGPATIRTDRGVLTSGTARITVKQRGGTEHVKVFASLEPSRAYVGQAVVATFAMAVAREIRISGYGLDVPFLTDIPGTRLLDPENLAERWDRSVRSTRRGLPGHTALNLDGVVAVARVSRRTIDGVPYDLYSVRRVLIPQEPGRHELGAASATANVVVGYRRRRGSTSDGPFFGGPFLGDPLFSRRRAVTRRVTASSEPLALEVLALPEEGRPADFSGAVGRYRLLASASPHDAVLGGEPILLTLTVRGEGNIETVGRPELAADSGFRVGSAEQHQETRFEKGKLAGVKRFVLPLRPRSGDVKEVPEARLVVFDPVEGRYVTLRTDPIPVRVTVPEDTGALEAVAVPRSARGRALELEEVRRDIEDIETEVDVSRSHAAWIHRPGGLLAFFVLPLAAYVGLSVVAARRRALREDRALARRLRAAREARAGLGTLRTAGESVGAADFAERLAKILKGYLADRFDRPGGEIPPEEAEGLLARAGAPSECAREARSLLHETGAARFGGGAVDREGWLRRAESLVESIEKGAKA